MSVKIYSSGSLVSSGAIIENAYIGYNNSMYVSSGGVANDTTINSGGLMSISSGGVANSTTVNNYGYMYIASGGVANSTTVGGVMSIGGVANSTTVNSGGLMRISSGGTALNVTWTPCVGGVYAEDGAYVTYTSKYSGVYFGSNNKLLSHTQTMDNKIVSSGSMYVMSGGVANDTTVNWDGDMYISSGGVANDTTVKFGGLMDISSGGVANNTTVNSGGRMYIASGGKHTSSLQMANGAIVSAYKGSIIDFTVSERTAEDGYLINDLSMISGTPTYTITVSAEQSDGTYKLAQGAGSFTGSITIGDGTTNYGSITVNGEDFVYNGTTYSLDKADGNLTLSIEKNPSVFIYSSGTLTSSGTVIDNATLANGGDNSMHISSGGVANSTTVSSGGGMYISSGGKHKGTLQMANGAIVYAFEGSIIDFTVVDRTASDGYLINNLSLIKGTPTYTITVSAEQSDGTYKLAQGAESFTGSITIGDGTTSYGSITVNGEDFVYEDTVFSLDQVNGNLILTVEDAPVLIYSSGTLTSAGKVIENATLAYGGNNSMHIYSGGTANDTTVNTGGELHISSGGTADGAVLNADGVIYVSSGALLNDAYVTGERNSAIVYTGGKITDSEITSGGKIIISGGSCSQVTLGGRQYRSNGDIEVYSGGVAENISIVNYGDMYVFSGGIASNIHVSSGGRLNAGNDDWGHYENLKWGTAVAVTVSSGGAVHVGEGGRVEDLKLLKGADAWVSGGGTLVDTEVFSGGRISVAATAVISNTNIASGGSVYLGAGGGASACNTIVQYGGQLTIDANNDSGGNGHAKLYGNQNFGGTVEIINVKTQLDMQGSTITLDITDRTDADSYIINDISWFNNANYVLNVSSNQAYGTYKLAQGAGSFTGSITIGDGTINYGSITVNGDVFKYNGVDYQLTQQNGNLHLTIDDSTPPAAPTYTVSNTALTNQNVTVSAVFSNDSVVKQYSLNGKDWQTYTDSIVFTENGTVSFRAQDAAGNISEVTTYEVTNIDKVAPTLDITADKTAPTNQNVVLTAIVSDGTVEYFDGKNWVAGSIFEVSANGTYQFRVTDAAGNSVTDSIIVSNIDKVAPTLDITADKTAPTNQNVVLTATVSDGTVEYFDGKNWVAGSTFEVSVNGTYQFRVTDEAGNTVTDSIVVNNIDKVAPTLDITADKTTPTNQNVVLTATVSDGTVEYFANGKWNVGTSLTVTENGTYQFRVTDAAGNSVTDSIVVNNIDKVAPTLDITADKTAPTNQNVVLTATVSDGTVEYFANGKWNVGTSLTVTENGTYQFRVTDAVGNTVTDSIVVNNIDKVAPTLEISGNATDWTNKNVILKATVSDGRVEHFDGEFWVSGSTFEVTENGTYQFRVTDAAGNVTQKSVTVDKIDKIAPDKPVAKADITSVTSGNVTVSATFAEDSVRNEYSFNVRTWLTYSREIVFDENGTVYFRSTDAAGNVSAITKYAVTNIDRVGPDKPVASADILDLTNQNVTVSAVFSNDSAIKQYSFDGQNWQTYTQGVVFEQNGTIYFRSYDASGNVSPTASYKVANIDKVAPTLEINGNVTKWTNEDVVLTAAVSDGTVEYFANGKWNAGTVFTAAENGTYQFRVTDEAGNVTQKSVVVDKIDKTAPVIDNVAADITEITHFDVKVTADFSDNNGFTAQYKINDGDWIDYLDGVIMSENGTVYFKAADEAGNETYAEYTVSNIDKLAPDMPIVTFWERGYISNDPIIVSAVFAENSALKQYSFNGVDWFDYTDALYVRTSGEVFFRSCDIAGNYSSVATAVVKEIDDTADSALTEYIFVNAKYSEKNTSNKEQNGIPLVYGENAFNTLYDFKHSADEKIVMLDAAVNIFNNTDLTDIGIMAANVSLPKKKMTVNNYSYSAKSSLRGKLNINGKDTGDVIFENFATVNLSNSAHVNSIEGGKSSSTYTVKTSYKNGVKNETVTHKITKSASGKAVLNNASANEISDYSSVTLDGSSVGKIENNAYKLTETVKTVGSTVVNSKRTEQFSAGGTVVLKNNSVVESVKNYKTVKITDSKAGAISNFAVTKIVNGTETRKVAGSVTLVRAEADTIENYSKVTMTDSHIGNALNVQRVTASKGFNTLEKFVGTVGNDTLTIGKNAVLVLNGADFGEGKDKFVNSGTLIFGSDFEINAETLSGKGNFAATSEVYEKLSGKVSGLLNLGQTYEGFRNSKYELADNTEKKAVKWDMKSDYNGWLNSDIGFEDTVDFIKFKAKENSVIKISGEFSGGTDKITLNGSVLTADADGNYIAMVSAKTDYILKLERNEMNSVNYEISLIA